MENLLISLFVFVSMALALYALGMQSYHTLPRPRTVQVNPKGKMDQYMWIAIFLFALICGLRYRCGSDCEAYADALKYAAMGIFESTRDIGVEPLFAMVTKIFSSLGLGRVLYLGFFAFVEIFFVWSALKTRKFLLPFAGVVLMLGPHFLIWNNGLRQMIVACIFVYALVQLIDKKNILLYVLLIALSYFIHGSAPMLIVGLLLLLYNYLPNKFIIIGIIVACVALGRADFIDEYIKLAESGLSLFGYSSYSDRLDYFLETESQVQNYGPRRIILLITYLIIVWYSDKMDAFYGKDKFFRISFLLMLIYACGTEMLISKSLLFSRPFSYFGPFVLLIASYLLWYLKQNKKILPFLIAVMITCSYALIANVAESKLSDEVSLYKFIFLAD